jgi:hypothetical protein
MTNRAAAVGACSVLASAIAVANPPFEATATSGTRHYRYTSVERRQGQPDARYRVDFDLVTDTKGGVTAVIRKAEAARGETWTTPTVTAECKTALHGGDDAPARITLAPLSAEAADSLGESLMSMCAPAAYFFPMTDILNVVLIQTSPVFRIDELTAVGKGVRFGGFKTKLDRLTRRSQRHRPVGPPRLSRSTSMSRPSIGRPIRCRSH